MITFILIIFSRSCSCKSYQSNIMNLNNSVEADTIVSIAIKLLAMWEC